MGNLHKLPKIVHVSKRRICRGHGSGRGKTGGRGTKGQKARGTIKPFFEGGQNPLIKRFPYLRGKGRNASQKIKALPVPLDLLNKLPEKTIVTMEILAKFGILKKDDVHAKIVAPKGEYANTLSFSVPCSKRAKEIIEKKGGKVL